MKTARQVVSAVRLVTRPAGKTLSRWERKFWADHARSFRRNHSMAFVRQLVANAIAWQAQQLAA